MITQKRLKELLKYDGETGVFTWVVGKAAASAGDIAGGVHAATGYNRIGLDRKRYFAHRLAWLYTYGEFPKHTIDHINHIRDDNRIENIRDVSYSENSRNLPIRSNNKSGTTGVCWLKRERKWFANIKTKEGRSLHLGYYDKKEEAVSVRLAANVEHGYHENHGCAR